MSLHDLPPVTPPMPGGETCGTPACRPVDLAHLSRQTMGDRELEREVLQLFVQQAEAVRTRILEAEIGERLFLAHGLKGSAMNIGAYAIAECAGKIEDSPADRLVLKRLEGLIDEVRDFVAAISR
ncbi:MAG: Hpt protein [Rhizobiaceae bacterium]|jgi:HPt (histidine-containing phosphotransfer) domain-containing protein|nr:Hpt protein [Rhizobiaceae bacterium]